MAASTVPSTGAACRPPRRADGRRVVGLGALRTRRLDRRRAGGSGRTPRRPRGEGRRRPRAFPSVWTRWCVFGRFPGGEKLLLLPGCRTTPGRHPGRAVRDARVSRVRRRRRPSPPGGNFAATRAATRLPRLARRRAPADAPRYARPALPGTRIRRTPLPAAPAGVPPPAPTPVPGRPPRPDSRPKDCTQPPEMVVR